MNNFHVYSSASSYLQKVRQQVEGVFLDRSGTGCETGCQPLTVCSTNLRPESLSEFKSGCRPFGTGETDFANTGETAFAITGDTDFPTAFIDFSNVSLSFVSDFPLPFVSNFPLSFVSDFPSSFDSDFPLSFVSDFPLSFDSDFPFISTGVDLPDPTLPSKPPSPALWPPQTHSLSARKYWHFRSPETQCPARIC